MTYALDTNTISYWIKGNRHIAKRLSRIMRQGDTVVIPPITYYEILRGFKHKAAPKKEFSFALICNAFGVGEMTLAAWEEAADIYARRRKTGNPIDDSGILIAAFCVVNNYALVTNNVKHFEGTDGLIIENWITE